MNTALKKSEEFLANTVGKTTGFIVSKEYFETLENNIAAKLVEQQFQKETGFDVPPAYFDTVENTILAAITSAGKSAKVIPLRTRIARFTAIAAAACILLLVGLQFLSKAKTTPFDTLAINDLENWVEENIVMIDSYDLNNALESSDFDGNELLSAEISDETIENYLNTVDASTILNEID